jgi:hypothetical protein
MKHGFLPIWKAAPLPQKPPNNVNSLVMALAEKRNHAYSEIERFDCRAAMAIVENYHEEQTRCQ